MRYIFIFLIYLLSINFVSAQYSESALWGIEPVKLPDEPVKERIYTGPVLPTRLYFNRLDNSIIENPGVRYAIQNLKHESFDDPKVNDALHSLLKYAEDERLKHIIDYLKKYTDRNMASQEQALQTLQEYISWDSVEFYKNNEHLLTGDYDEYLNTDLQTFVNYVRNDSDYIWIRNASRDSVFMEVMNLADNSIRFWLNNGRTSYYRFWAGNKSGDTIGTWIQILPAGNRLKIYVDQDVHQTVGVVNERINVPGTLKNDIGKEYTVIVPVRIGELSRRYWTYYSEVEIAMSQGKLANWASGGENSLSLLSNLRYYWNYNRHKTSWENWVHYRFGFMKNGDEDIRKNEDRFEMNSKLGQKAFNHWFYTAQFNMLTQLFNSYEYPKDAERKLVANFMSPGYFTLSLGMDYKPNNNFSLVISPIAGKWNFVRDTAKISAGRYGISEEGKRFKREAGAQLNLISKVNNLFKIMSINNELKVFMSYEKKDRFLNLGKDDEEKKRIPLTANWKMTLNFKINYFMSASIYTETIYDENYSRKFQFKENLNLGIKFRF